MAIGSTRQTMYRWKPMHKITVCFFGALSEAVNTKSLELTYEHDLRLEELKAQLVAQGPQWKAIEQGHILCALNHEMITGNPLIKAGDEVALFPPVTGG